MRQPTNTLKLVRNEMERGEYWSVWIDEDGYADAGISFGANEKEALREAKNRLKELIAEVERMEREHD